MTDVYGDILPNIRCMGCGKEISSMYDRYVDLVNTGVDQTEIWKELGIRRNCCMTDLMRPPKIVDNSGGKPITILSGDPKNHNLRTKQGRINNNLAVLAMGNSRRKKAIISDSEKTKEPFSLVTRSRSRNKATRSRFTIGDKSQPSSSTSSVSLASSSSTAPVKETSPETSSTLIDIPAPSGANTKINLSALRSTKSIKSKIGFKIKR